MAKAKTATLSFRIKPTLKDALRITAEREHRSIANMVEVMVIDYCRRNGVAVPDQTTLFDEPSPQSAGATRVRGK